LHGFHPLPQFYAEHRLIPLRPESMRRRVGSLAGAWQLSSLLSNYPAFDVVAEAASAEEALAEFRREVPDVCLLDIRLGGGSGLDVPVVFGKLGVSRRAEAVGEAARRELLKT
jgi:hypothetical protein